MKVYRLSLDVKHYQFFLTPKDEDSLILFRMDGTSQEEIWTPPPVYILYPLLKAGGFYQFGSSVLITSPAATEILRSFLEMAGELLPLPYLDHTYTVLNVTECINCLDEENTIWEYTRDTGERTRPKIYAFHTNRFTESQLFKIPETRYGEILLVEGLHRWDEEFRYIVENNNLQGLIFEEIWTDE